MTVQATKPLDSGHSGLPQHIPSLDGLRAVSVLLVIAGHAALYGPTTPRWQIFSLVFLNAEIGVTWFFIISGFLITTLLLREQARFGKISLSRFFIRRALRILPPFYALISVVILLKYLGGLAIPAQRIWTAATFTYNIVKHPAWGSWWLGHTWSLSVEEQFYLCWPFLFMALGIKKSRTAAICLILVAPVFRIGLLLGHPQFANQISGLLPSRMDALMLGALAALSYSHPRVQYWLDGLSGRTIGMLGTFVFMVSPLLAYALGNVYVFAVGFTLECLGLLIMLLYCVSRPHTWIGRVLNAKPTAFIGTISYDIYLWQQLFITPQNVTVTGRPGLNLLFLAGFSLSSYFFIGKPLMKLSRRMLRQANSQEAVQDA